MQDAGLALRGQAARRGVDIMTPPVSANAITADLLVAINAEYQPEVLLFRLNIIVARATRGAVRSAPNGVADVIGCIRGRAVAIEVKAGRDTLRPAQVNFRDQWIRAGGVHVVARSLEQGMKDLREQINA